MFLRLGRREMLDVHRFSRFEGLGGRHAEIPFNSFMGPYEKLDVSEAWRFGKLDIH